MNGLSHIRRTTSPPPAFRGQARARKQPYRGQVPPPTRSSFINSPKSPLLSAHKTCPGFFRRCAATNSPHATNNRPEEISAGNDSGDLPHGIFPDRFGAVRAHGRERSDRFRPGVKEPGRFEKIRFFFLGAGLPTEPLIAPLQGTPGLTGILMFPQDSPPPEVPRFFFPHCLWGGPGSKRAGEVVFPRKLNSFFLAWVVALHVLGQWIFPRFHRAIQGVFFFFSCVRRNWGRPQAPTAQISSTTLHRKGPIGNFSADSLPRKLPPARISRKTLRRAAPPHDHSPRDGTESSGVENAV